MPACPSRPWLAVACLAALALLSPLPGGAESHRTHPEEGRIRAVEVPGKPGEKKVPDSTYVPTPRYVVGKMLELAQVSERDLIYDLGSGDGRTLITAASTYGARGVGVELLPELVERARKNAEKENVAHLVEIRRGDMFEVDLSDADVVVVYQPPKLLARLRPQIADMKPGARIVSHYFLMPDIPPDETVVLDTEPLTRRHEIHLWTTPLASPK